MNTMALIEFVDKLYPNATTEQDKIIFMNVCMNKLSKDFGMIAEDDSLKTVVDQDAYAYPTDIKDISQIVSIAIGNKAIPANRYDFQKYTLNVEDDNPMVENGYFNIVDSNGVKKFVIYPIPKIVDLPIVIKYRKPLTLLSSGDLEAEPEFDSKYHDILVYWCCHMICVQGSSPDAFQADMFMAKYNDSLDEIWRDKIDKESANTTKRRDNSQWHRTGSYARGD